jgi:hypothetical protein
MTAIERSGLVGARVRTAAGQIATGRHASFLRASLTWQRMFYRARHR